MIKIVILILCFGLSTLTTLLLNFNETWKIPVSIIGFGLAYILVLILLLYITTSLVTIGVNTKKKVTKYNPLYRKFLNFFSWMFLSLINVKPTISGLDKLPKDENFILIQNHISNVDPILTNYVLRKTPLIFVTKTESFKTPAIGKLFHGLGYIKLERKNGINDASEFMRAIKWLHDEQSSLAVYPEGTRNKTFPNPLLNDFKEQLFAIIQKTNKPIVISTVSGTNKVNNNLLFKIHHVKIDFLSVIKPEDYSSLSPAELSENIKQIMLKNLK